MLLLTFRWDQVTNFLFLAGIVIHCSWLHVQHLWLLITYLFFVCFSCFLFVTKLWKIFGAHFSFLLNSIQPVLFRIRQHNEIAPREGRFR